ncbi:MAG: 3'(2'),5'-bisphosphate nucleotidase CysQ [Parvularculaceae bacterium]|nr:3'(2'),5'-bisphosphate nucleotidase CysQ [Parvularculaceae bacterium]
MTGPRADYGWLSEESQDDLARLQKPRTLVVDPIDGTRAFLRGDDQFTVCLAVVEAGEAVASVIYAPARDELYAAAKDLGTTLNGPNVQSSDQSTLEGANMIGADRMFSHPGWPQPWPSMNVAYKNSTSYRMALVASGAFDATIALAAKADWDAAPGTLIAQEAGAVVSDHLQRGFEFGKANPRQAGLVCTAAQLYPEVVNRLSHLPSDLSSLRP